MAEEWDEGHLEFDITDEVGTETDKAILVDIEGDKYWIPKSVIHDDSEVYKKGTVGCLIVKKWWAEKEGLY